MKAEYHLDYSKAKPNRFGRAGTAPLVVVVQPDVAKVFATGDEVNAALRMLISAVPARRARSTKSAKKAA